MTFHPSYTALIAVAIIVLTLGVQPKEAHSEWSELSRSGMDSLTSVMRENNKVIARDITSIREATESLGDRVSRLQDMFSDSMQTLTSSLQLLQTMVRDSLKPQQTSISTHLSSVEGRLKTTRLWGIIAALFLMSLVSTLAIIAIRRIGNKRIQEQAIALDTRLADIMERQLALAQRSHENVNATVAAPDHELAIRVGQELHRMRQRLNSMASSAPGMVALGNALTRLEDELNQRGYSLVDLTGQLFHDQMVVRVASIVEDPRLGSGQEIISRMITPHILYQGAIVKHGEIEVSVASGTKKATERA